MANEVATQEKDVVYQVEGREVRLSASLVRKYLVRGHGNLVTAQEMALFMGICRAREMDPWAGDVYIIKYAEKDSAAIVASIDFVRSRARTQPDCQGWTCGVIVEGPDNLYVKDSSGLVKSDEKILGGWAECTPKGWLKPTRLEVNLAGYIKRTNTGQITKFWSPENQPTMIMKVAEMQLLRRIWPAAAGKMYLAEEIGGPTMGEGMDLGSIDMEPAGNGESKTWTEKTAPEETVAEKFGRLAEEGGISDRGNLDAFIRANAAALKKTEVEMQATACSDFPAFLKIFSKAMAKKQEKEKAEIKAAEAKKAKAEKKEPQPDPGPFPGPFNEGELVNQSTGEVTRDPSEMKDCPQDGEPRAYGWCKNECPTFQDCER